MPKEKIYKCSKCNRVLSYKPTRLVKQLYVDEKGSYKQYYPVKTYDFCDTCYEKIEKWLNFKKI